MAKINFFCTLFLFVTMANGQHIDIKGSNKFVQNDKFYRFHELESILSADASTSDLYHQSMKANKSAKIMGFISLGSLGLSFVALSYAFSDGSIGSSPGTELWALLTVLGPIAGTIALVHKGKAIRTRKKAIETFNNAYNQSYIDYRKQPYLCIGIKGGSISMVYNF